MLIHQERSSERALGECHGVKGQLWKRAISFSKLVRCQGHSTLSSQCVFEGARLTQLVQLVTAGRLFLGHEGRVDL